MPESAAFSRVGRQGGAKASTLSGDLSAAATTIPGADLSTWAGATANGPTTWTLSRGNADEESGEATGISGNDLTGVTRGLFGTSAQAHTSGVSLELTSSKRDFDEANYWVAELAAAITAAGDLMYADADNSLARLAKGTAAQVLAMNAGATAPEWVAAIPVNDDASVPGVETTTSTSFTDVATAGPAVTVATGTKALVIVSGYVINGTAGSDAYMGAAVSGATTRAAADAEALRQQGPGVTQRSYAYIAGGLTAGSNTFTAKYRVSANTGSFGGRHISVVNLGS